MSFLEGESSFEGDFSFDGERGGVAGGVVNFSWSVAPPVLVSEELKPGLCCF